MAETKTPAEIAERLQKRRMILLLLFPILFLTQPANVWFGRLHDAAVPLRNVDKVEVLAYGLWAISLLILLATGGSLGRSKAVRALLSDELTRNHRGKAYAVGFWGLIITCSGLYVASVFTPLPPIVILHSLLTVGVYGSCLTFAFLEFRAARD